MKALIIDTETTNADENAEVIEAAWIDCYDDGRPGGYSYCERFKPEGVIAFGAMATHHIIPDDLISCRPSSEFQLPDADFVIGHNVDFDCRVMEKADINIISRHLKRICTLALSRYLWPELDSHKQGAVMYFLFGADAQEMVKGAHNALEDVRMCQMIFKSCVCELAQRGIACDTFEEIWQASETARIPTIMTFGKHKGMAIKDVPYDYVLWLLKQPDIDPYLRQALTN